MIKKILFFAIFISLNVNLFSQINPREYDKNYMYTVFEDEFDSTDINRQVWSANSIYRGIGQLIDSSLTYDVSDGKLELTMEHIPNYNDSADYVGQEFWTKDSFLYGSFECKASFANGIGSWPAFWSFLANSCEGPEIDFAEYFCWYNVNQGKKLGHYIHHWICSGGEVNTNYDDDPEVFLSTTNIYKCIWTPEKVEFYVDSVKKLTYENNGEDWFPYQAVRVIVSQQILQPGSGGSVHTPQTSYFDYVKVKQFFLAPEITISSDVICTTGTAIMDVAPDAINITWSLSPGYLFSGAITGSGTSATITPSASYHGLGKITYNFDMPSGESFSAEKEFRVNGPGYDDISFDVYKSDGTPATNMSGHWLMCPNTTYHIYVDNDGPCSTSNYDWTIPSAWTKFYTYQNMISVNTNSSPGGPVSVDATTCCNNEVAIITDYMGTDYNCGYYYMTFSPNPATNETILTLETTSEEKVFDENLEWEIEIYDQTQLLKERITKLKCKEYTLKTTTLKEGVYTVRVKLTTKENSNKILTGKLVVKR